MFHEGKDYGWFHYWIPSAQDNAQHIADNTTGKKERGKIRKGKINK